jgi:hypothetical protein
VKVLAAVMVLSFVLFAAKSCGSDEPSWYQEVKKEHPGVTLEEACALEASIARRFDGGEASERVQDCEDVGAYP